MKKVFITLLIISLVFASFVSCSDKKAEATSAEATTETSSEPAKVSEKEASYAFGIAIGTSIKQTHINIDYNEFVKGMKDIIEDKPGVDTNAARLTLQSALIQASQAMAERNAKESTEFLTENAKRAEVKTTASGLQYEVIKEGNGVKPTPEDTVKIDYRGTYSNGEEFDGTIDKSEPAHIPVGQVIEGFSEGLQLMSVGSKYKLFIPPELAYGSGGTQSGIEPNKMLIFEIELHGIDSKETTSE